MKVTTMRILVVWVEGIKPESTNLIMILSLMTISTKEMTLRDEKLSLTVYFIDDLILN